MDEEDGSKEDKLGNQSDGSVPSSLDDDDASEEWDVINDVQGDCKVEDQVPEIIKKLMGIGMIDFLGEETRDTQVKIEEGNWFSDVDCDSSMGSLGEDEDTNARPRWKWFNDKELNNLELLSGPTI
ncbi:hypothetical protein Drorol1_Dr00019602 [Drosera rotundifolia]